MWHAACEMCMQSQFSPDDVTAFTVRNKAIEFVELHGREPWSGVRVICDRCVGKLTPILELRIVYYRGKADRLAGALIEAARAIEAFNPMTTSLASLRFVAEQLRLTAEWEGS